MGKYLPNQAKHLAIQREKKGYTQEQVAELIGCTVKTYRSWEKGKTSPAALDLVNLSELYGVSTDYLLGLIEEKNHDVKFICEYTGLSEASIIKLIENKNSIMFHSNSTDSESFSDIISSLIEHDRFKIFIYRLMQSRALNTTITKHHKQEKQKIEDSFAYLQSNGYAVLAPGQNNVISIYDAKQEISGIIDDLFRVSDSGFIELRN